MTTNPQMQIQAPSTPTWAMLRTLGGIAMLSGLLVVLVFQFTRPIIAENQRLRTEQAVFQVIHGAASKRDFVVTDDGDLRPAGSGAQGITIYGAYDSAGKLLGVAIPGAARGYQDVVQFLFGYNPQCQCVIGSKVLKSTETPGLGDKIESDPEFLKNFVALDVQLDAAGDGLAHAVVPVKHGTKTHPWEVDAISGATISSSAMARALNGAAQQFAPVIQRHLATLEAANPSEAR